MELTAWRYVLKHCPIETGPVHSGPLAAPPQCLPPSAADFFAEAIQSVQIGGYGVVAEIACHYAAQPGANNGYRFVPSSEKRFPNRGHPM